MRFNTHLIQALAELESKSVARHLIPYEEVATVFADRSILQRIKILLGFSTNVNFETVSNFNESRTYLLKSGVSASKALLTLTTEHQMVVDCGVIIVIAHYIAILRTMIDKFGKDKGCEHFDRIFGHPKELVPRHRRMNFNASGSSRVPNKQEERDSKQTNFYQAISAVFLEVEYANVSQMVERVPIGSHIVFKGDPKYPEAHPAGCDQLYNCIVVAKSPLTVRTYGHDRELRTDDLVQIHANAYARTPSEESIFYSKGKNLAVLAAQPTTSRDQIIGFKRCVIELNETALKLMLEGSLTWIFEFFERCFVHAAQVGCLDPKSYIAYFSSTANLETAPVAAAKPAAPAVIFSDGAKSRPSATSSSATSNASSDSWFKPGAFKNGF